MSAGALVVVLGVVGMCRGSAVLARHRAEAAADLAALAAAGRIGIGADGCAAAERVVRRNGAAVKRCEITTDAAGRSGVVRVVVALPAELPLVGSRLVTASARAARLPGAAPATDERGAQRSGR